jgi:AraC-like DNA-binding protein
MEKPAADQFANSKRIDILCEWIDENIDQRIGWADLSRVSGLDNLALRLAFLKYRFMTPMNYIKIRREQAKKNINLL